MNERGNRDPMIGDILSWSRQSETKDKEEVILQKTGKKE